MRVARGFRDREEHLELGDRDAAAAVRVDRLERLAEELLDLLVQILHA